MVPALEGMDSTLFHEGITLVSNPWGVPQFGATFFGITGLHMFHVFTGVLYLAGMAVGCFQRQIRC